MRLPRRLLRIRASGTIDFVVIAAKDKIIAARAAVALVGSEHRNRIET
jgi:hypothetical protein